MQKAPAFAIFTKSKGIMDEGIFLQLVGCESLVVAPSSSGDLPNI